MEPELLTLGEKASEIAASWSDAYAAIIGAGVSLDAVSARTPGESIEDIGAQVVAVLALANQLRRSEAAQLRVIAPKLRSLKAALEGLGGQSNAIATALGPWAGASASDQNGHLQIQMRHAERGEQTYDLGAPLSSVYQDVGRIVDVVPYILWAAKEKVAPRFDVLVRGISSHAESAQIAFSRIEEHLAASAAAYGKTQKALADTESALTQAQEVAGIISAAKSTAETNVAELEQKLARAREVSKDADSLQARTTGFASQFEAFDAQLKSRLNQFSEFEEDTKAAEELNASREEKIDALLEKADTMIRGVTTAGLSKSLDEARALYEDRLNSAQNHFLISVVALLVCCLPIAAPLIPGPWQDWFAAPQVGATTDVSPWLSVLGKVVLLVPATWATAFFASNYAELFHLSREYAHKAALAKAIDGFKREAPEYAQEIVGSVFLEIQDNPGARKAPPPATPQNPVAEKFFARVLEAIKTVKSK